MVGINKENVLNNKIKRSIKSVQKVTILSIYYRGYLNLTLQVIKKTTYRNALYGDRWLFSVFLTLYKVPTFIFSSYMKNMQI